MLVISVIPVMHFNGPVVDSASAGSNWIQTTDVDFNNGVLTNLTVTPEGNVTLALQTKYVEDDYFDESMIASKRNVIINSSMGEIRLNRINMTFGGTLPDEANAVLQTSDGGYVFAGSTDSYSGFDSDVWLLKTDSLGVELWNRTFGLIGFDIGYDVKETSDGGLVITAVSQTAITGSEDFWLIKTDENGIEQWNFSWGGFEFEYPSCVQETSDGGFAMMGLTTSYGAGLSDAWLVKGWSKSFGGPLNDYGYWVQETADSGYVISGKTASFGAGGDDAWLIKTNETGTEEWNRTFGGASNDGGYAVLQTSDGGFIISGYTASFGAGGYDVWIIKTNETGFEQWNKTYGAGGSDQGKSIQPTTDGGYVIAGVSSSYGDGSSDVYVLKIDSLGNEQWVQSFGGSDVDEGTSAAQTSDGGYIISGTTQSFGAGNKDAWLMKTYPVAVPEWNVSYGDDAWETHSSVRQTFDKGYVMAGDAIVLGRGDYDVWLVTTDSSGNLDVYTTYGGLSNDYGLSVIQTSAGDIVIAGWTESGAGGSDALLIKTNSGGGQYWYKTFGGINYDSASKVQETSDGNYIVVGSTMSFGAGGSDIWLIKVNATGGEIWNKTIGNSSSEGGYAVQQTPDGGFIILGNNLIKTDDLGNEQWNKSYSGKDIQLTNDGGYIIYGNSLIKTYSNGTMEWSKPISSESGDQTSDGGYILASNTPSSDMWLIKTNSTGDEEWNETFDRSPMDYASEVRQTIDGGYIAAGYTWSPFPREIDGWLVKYDGTWGQVSSGNLLEGNSSYSMDNFTCNVSMPRNTTLKVQFSRNNSYWYNSTGSLDAWNYLTGGFNAIDLSSLGWNGSGLYYRVRMSSDGIDTPVLSNINLSYQRYFPSGWLESESFDSGGINPWKNINWTSITPPDTEIKFQLRTATSQGSLSSKDFVGPDGTNATFYTTPNSTIWPGHNGERWLEYKAYLITGNGTITPILSDVTIFYNIPPSQPVSLNPIDNFATNDSTPFFSWTFVDSDSTQAGFQILIDNESSFASVDFDSGEQFSSNEFWQFPVGTGYSSIPDDVWYWKVRTRDSDGNWSEYSGYHTLKLDTVSPDPPVAVISQPDNWTAINLFNVSWTNPFDIAGISGVYYKLGSPPNSDTDGIYVLGNNITYIENIAVPVSGNHTIYIWLNDTLGNKNHLNSSVTYLHYDVIAPDPPINLTADPPEWSNATQYNISWENPVDLSGIAGAYYKIGSPPVNATDGIYVAGFGNNSISNITVPGLGNNTIYVWLNDTAGNKNHLNYSITYLLFAVSEPGPPIGLAPTPPDWTNVNTFNVTWANPVTPIGIIGAYYKLDAEPTSNTDGTYVEGADITTITGITVPGEGNHTIYLWLNDTAGQINYLNYSITNLYYEQTAPGAPIGVTASPSNWTNMNAFTVSWTNPADMSGIAGAYYKLDTIPTSSTDGVYVQQSDITSISSIPVSGDGNHTIYIWLRDRAGNVDQNDRDMTYLHYDGTMPGAPTGVSAVPSSWTSINSFTVSWSNPLDTSGIVGAYYKVDSAPTSGTDGIFVAGPDIKSISGINVTGDGTHTIYIWLKDNATNTDHVDRATATVYYDSSAPGFPTGMTASPNTWTSTNSFTVSWTNPVNEASTSGVAGAYYKLDSVPANDTDGIYVPGSGIISISGINVTGDGAHTVYIWLKDNVGNVDFNNHSTATLYYDSSAPGSPTGATVLPNSWTSTNSFDITWTNPADLSGIDGAYYKLDSAPTSNTDGILVSGTDIETLLDINVGSDGPHTIYIWLKDAVGNINYNNRVSAKLYYDGSAPDAPTAVSGNPSTWSLTNSFTVSWTNPSDLTGIAGVYYKLDTTPVTETDGIYVDGADISTITNIQVSGEGQHKVYMWLVDGVNNINHNNRSSGVLYFDETPPGKPEKVAGNPVSWSSVNSFTVSWINPIEISNISGAYYKRDFAPTSDTDGTLVPGADITSMGGIPVDSEGQHIIYVWLVDAAGNTDYNNYNTTSLFLDGTAPSAPPSIPVDPNSWSSDNSFSVDWTEPLDASGIQTGAYYYVGTSPPATQLDGTWTSNKPFTITDAPEGETKVYIWLLDNAGNRDHLNYGSAPLRLDTARPTISHTAVTAGSMDIPITISANVDDAGGGVNQVLLYFKKPVETAYNFSIMDESSGTYTATFPGNLVTPEGLEYYIKATDISTPPNTAFYGSFGQVSVKPTTHSDIDILISAIDKTPPSVSSYTPTGSGIEVNALITATFSEEMDQAVTETAVSIKPATAGTFNWVGKQLNFEPTNDLRYDSIYVIDISTTAQDLAANRMESNFSWQFRTELDSVPPGVSSREPRGNEVEVDDNIEITFTEPMDRDSAEDAFSISPAVSGTFSWEGNNLIFNPDDPLTSATTYEVVIDTNAKDEAGNRIERVSWVFTTLKDLPSVSDWQPRGGFDVSVDTAIEIVFTQTMDRETTRNAFSIEPSVPGTFTWTAKENTDDTLVFKPTDPLEYNTNYTFAVNRSALNNLNKPLDEDFDQEFRTEKPPEIAEDTFWDKWEPVITAATILASMFAFIFGVMSLRRKRRLLHHYLDRIDDTYEANKDDYKTCHKELMGIRTEIKDDIKKRRIEENHFLILDKKIDDYLKEMKVLRRGGAVMVSRKKGGKRKTEEAEPDEEFGEEPDEDYGEDELDGEPEDDYEKGIQEDIDEDSDEVFEDGYEGESREDFEEELDGDNGDESLDEMDEVPGEDPGVDDLDEEFEE